MKSIITFVMMLIGMICITSCSEMEQTKEQSNFEIPLKTKEVSGQKKVQSNFETPLNIKEVSRHELQESVFKISLKDLKKDTDSTDLTQDQENKVIALIMRDSKLNRSATRLLCVKGLSTSHGNTHYNVCSEVNGVITFTEYTYNSSTGALVNVISATTNNTCSCEFD